MPDTLKLEIVTPYKTVFSEDVTMETIPAIEGEIGVYPQHERLITRIVPGEIIIASGATQRSFAVGEGLVDIAANHVSIVTDIDAEQIDEAKVEEARARAAARLQEKISDEEVASVNASLARSLAQLQVRRRRRM